MRLICLFALILQCICATGLVKKSLSGTKIYNDIIHGPIKLSSLAASIIKTSQFERLRDVKQLGPLSYVIPSAKHSRYEHCIGTYHLAGVLFDKLRDTADKSATWASVQDPNQRLRYEEAFSDETKEMVQLAGLCHDLGHGPFSHSFDAVTKHIDETWTHEYQSGVLLKHLTIENKIPLTQEQINLIISLITGDALPSTTKPVPAFIFDIIANHRNSLDVDKFDYINRDSHYLNANVFLNYQQ